MVNGERQLVGTVMAGTPKGVLAELHSAHLARRARFGGVPARVNDDQLVSRLVERNKELEASLEKHNASIDALQQRIIGLEHQIEVQREYIIPRTALKTMPLLIQLVGAYYGIKPIAIISQNRAAEITIVRHIVCYMARKFTPYSYTQIGRSLGDRDHTTIIHSINRVKEMIEEDPGFKCRIDAIDAVIARGLAE